MRILLCSLLLLVSVTATAAETKRIHLIFTNDIHGYVDPRGATFMNPNFPPPLGGAASAATYVEKVRAEIAGDPDSDMIMLDGGDTWQGSPVGTLTKGRVLEVYFDQMGYDAVTLGNHEFDSGLDVPERMSADMKRPFVCCNVYNKNTGERVDWVEPYRIVEKAGLRIGIIGANTPGTAHMAFPENIAGLEFRPIAQEVQKACAELEGKVDLIFLTMHEGLPFDPITKWEEVYRGHLGGEEINDGGAMELAGQLPEVPVIVAGHTHRGYDRPWIHPLTHNMVFETFGNGSSLGHAVILVDKETKEVVGYEAPRREGVLVSLFEDQWWPQEAMQAALAPHIEEVQGGLEVVVGETLVPLTRAGKGNSPMGNLVTDAFRSATGADIAFTNGGGLRVDLPRGKVSFGDMLRLLPFGNSLVVVQIEGRMLREIFDAKASARSSGLLQSGARLVVDPDAESGSRILSFEIGGEPLQADKLYRVATSNYLLEGNSGLGLLTTVPDNRVEFTEVLGRDAVIRYLEAQGSVSPRLDDRYRENRDGPVESYLQGWTKKVASE